MSKNIILASVQCLPKLVDGKVCVYDPATNSYTLYNPSRFTTISDHFNPMDYSILISEKYRPCIIYSNAQERREYEIELQVRQMYKNRHLKLYGNGDKIHIHSRRGVYTILSHTKDTIAITCRKWQHDPNPFEHVRVVPAHDFKCVAGGVHNYSE